MCTPIYVVHNITLWSCPITTVCPSIVKSVHNITSTLPVSSSPVSPSPPMLPISPSPVLSPSPSILPISPSPVLSPSPVSPISPVSPVALSNNHSNLRHSYNTTNNTEASINVGCLCQPELQWLHVLWIVPFSLLIVCCFWLKRRGVGKIKNLFVPKPGSYLTRSRSWPQISAAASSPIQNRARSEPIFDSIVI